MKLLIAVPALNEEESIGSVVSQLRQNFPSRTILVINDGSTDKTAEIAKKTGANVVTLPINVGVGAALKVAFKYAFENDYDAVLQIDGDGQHPASEAKKLIENFSSDSIIIGSRFLSESHNYEVGKLRRIGMLTLAKVTNWICKLNLTDVTSGFRLTTGVGIEIFAKSYPIDYLGDTVESIVIASRAGIAVKEIPIKMNKRETGSPSQGIFKSSWYLVRVLLVVVLSGLKSK